MTATPPPGQPATPAEALRWYAAHPSRADPPPWREQLRRWADELDAAPAAPLNVEPAALAAERQRIAHEGTGYVPPWEELTDREREMSALEASHWLKAFARAARATNPGPAAPTTQASERRVLEAAVVAARCYDELPRGGEFHTAMEALADAVAEHEARRGPPPPPAGTEADHA